TAVLIQLRRAGTGKLSAIVRQRDREQPWALPQRVRQIMLALEPGADRPVSNEEPPDDDAGRTPSTSRDVALLYTIGADGKGLRVVALPEGYRRAGYPAWSP